MPMQDQCRVEKVKAPSKAFEPRGHNFLLGWPFLTRFDVLCAKSKHGACLTAQALAINRLAGLPYPLWRDGKPPGTSP